MSDNDVELTPVTIEETKQTNGDTKQTNGDTKQTNGDTKQTNGDSKEMNGDTKEMNGDIKEMNGGTRELRKNEIALEFDNLSKEVTITLPQKKKPWQLCAKKAKQEQKQILFGVSGQLLPGEVTAIMGPSGSGKTTLLDCLCHRNMTGVTGTVTLNNKLMGKAMKRQIGYVVQSDLFFMNLTLREHLTYIALLRLGGEKALKIERVNELIEELSITKCKDTKIMLLSGGEKKRLNIATELLTQPSLLYLDEPTSGLDATIAFELMKTLKKIANDEHGKKTILTSIHQPSSQVFQSFSKIILLTEGHMVYCGKPSLALKYFNDLGHPSPSHYNPADFLLDLISETELHDKFINAFVIPKSSILDVSQVQNNDLNRKKFQTTWCEQFIVLTKRANKNAANSLFTGLKFVECFGLGTISGFCWWQIAYEEKTFFDRISLIFYIMTFWPMITLFNGIMAFPTERAVIDRERASGTFRLSAYFWAKAFADAPLLITFPAIFMFICYPMAGLNPSFTNFVSFLGAQLLACIAGESVGLLIGVSVADFESALVLGVVSQITLILVSGYFIENVPFFMAPLRFISLTYYAFEVCLNIEFQGVSLLCDGSGWLTEACENRTHVPGEVISQNFGDGLPVGRGILGLTVILLLARLLAYICLRFLTFKTGRSK